MSPEFHVKTEVFEGPLELLLNLIEKRKLHINDISLAAVTDDFVAYMNAEESSTMTRSTNFIWVASALLLIKSKSLLPSLSLTEEEEGDIENLERRLKLYQIFREVTPKVMHSFGEHMLFKPQVVPEREVVFAPDRSCSIPELFTHASAIVQNLPKQQKTPEVSVERAISLEEMIESLSERISTSLSLSFKDFSKHTKKAGTKPKEIKVHMIVGFLAMLELVKRGTLDVTQDSQFGDITMKTEHVGTPRYNNWT